MKPTLQEEIVREILASWGKGLGPMKDTWGRYCSEDIVWWSGRETITGQQDCQAALDGVGVLLGDGGYVKVPIKTLVAQEDLVVIERSDDLYRADGTLIATVPVTGVLTFADGLITEWRDYCVDWLSALAPRDTETDFRIFTG